MPVSIARNIVLVVLTGLAIPACAVFTSLSNASDSVSTALGGASTSLESISTSLESISGSLASSSGSSSGDDEEEEQEDEAFRRDVRSYTAAFARQGGTAAQYEYEIARIARLHGLVNWRTQKAALTFEAVGAGLQAAGLSREDVAERFGTLAPRARAHLLVGFDREARS